MAEEGLSEADICDVVVCQHVPSWTAMCYTGKVITTRKGKYPKTSNFGLKSIFHLLICFLTLRVPSSSNVTIVGSG